MSRDQPVASVVIPTRDRAESLARTLEALRSQMTEQSWELIVVDDGSNPPLAEDLLMGLPDATLLRREGAGPAAARNAGIAAARGRYVLFTDDDTEPEPGWIDAAVRFLEDHPEHAGVEGRVESPPFDPLRAMSLESHEPGKYWTCNAAYRRDALEQVGGFDEGFPFPHCEDRDLAYRAMRVGPVGYADAMGIVHHPRDMTLGELAGRGRLAASEVRLFERHRSHFGRVRNLPGRLFPVVQSSAFWSYMLRSAGRNPRRIARALAVSVGYSLQVVRATVLRLPTYREAASWAKRTLPVPLVRFLSVEIDRWHPAARRRRANEAAAARERERIITELLARNGPVVQAGPFAGLRLPVESSWGTLAPLLVGSYEAELHPLIEELIAARPRRVVNVGCAEGYYAVGLARRLPAADVYAFDIDENARRAAEETARANSVADRVHVEARCTTERLQDLARTAETLVVVDCEGCELDLLRPDLAPALAQASVLVELHDFMSPGSSAEIVERFASTHAVRVVEETQRSVDDYVALRDLGPADQAIAVDELRPPEAQPMQWAIFVPRSSASRG